MRKLCGISSTQFDDCYALLSFAVNTAADALDALVFPQMLLHSRAEHAGSLAVDVAVPDPADGFQAWSMDDVLAMETSLASVVGLAAEGGAWTGADAGHDVWDQAGDGGLSGRTRLAEPVVLDGRAVQFLEVHVQEIVGVDVGEVTFEVIDERGGELLFFGDFAQVALECVAGACVVHDGGPPRPG